MRGRDRPFITCGQLGSRLVAASLSWARRALGSTRATFWPRVGASLAFAAVAALGANLASVAASTAFAAAGALAPLGIAWRALTAWLLPRAFRCGYDGRRNVGKVVALWFGFSVKALALTWCGALAASTATTATTATRTPTVAA